MSGEGTPQQVVGIGASAGGVDALVRLVRHLPADLPAAVCVVLHIPAGGRSLLAPILGRHSDLPVEVAEHGAALAPGRIYVAPPDRHLTVAGGRLCLDRGPKENAARPAVDTLLRSLAVEYGELAVGVILSGALTDGSIGAVAIHHAGGTVIVQDPREATVPSMPESALRAVGGAAAALELEAIAERLAEIVRARPEMRDDVVMTAPDLAPDARSRPDGPPSTLTCPECHGPLWELEAGRLKRYECRVGHAYSEESLVVEQGSAVEAALWSALEALEERAEFLGRLSARYGAQTPRLRERHRRAAADAHDRAGLIRRALAAQDEGAYALDGHVEADA